MLRLTAFLSLLWLLSYGKGADVVVHEVAAANEKSIQQSALINKILEFHTSPEDAAIIFDRIRPKLAVYSHIVLLSANPSIPLPTIKDLITRTQKKYKGALEIGEDLLTIEIGDEVKILKR